MDKKTDNEISNENNMLESSEEVVIDSVSADIENNGETKTETEIEVPASSDNPDDNTVDTFLSSLKSITPDDIAQAPSKKKLSKRMAKIIKFAMLTVCLSVFIVSVYMIISNVMAGKESSKIYSEYEQDFFSLIDRSELMDYLPFSSKNKPTLKHGVERPPEISGGYDVIQSNNPFFQNIKAKLLSYQEENSDIYGWIQVDGTNISYAVVKGDDNDYYLNHTITKKYNINGSIFADFNCKDDHLENPNLIFYGHNMVYPGRMFNELSKFTDKAFFENNRYVTLYTIDGILKYEIFSIYETEATYKYCQFEFENDEAFVEWCNEMKENSMFEREDIGEFDDTTRILTLSTCTNGEASRRYSLQCKLISIEK